MKYLANIVSQNKVEVSEFINVVDNMEDIEPNLPTLIIGYNAFIKNNYDEGIISVIDRYIDDKTMWTFSKYEKATEYEKDLKEFQENIFEELDLLKKYTYFNLMTSTLQEKKKFINILKSNLYKCVYIYENSFMYILIKDVIIGILIDDVEFFGVKTEKILSWFEKLPNTKFIDNNRFLLYRTQKCIENKKYLTPTLYKMKYSR